MGRIKKYVIAIFLLFYCGCTVAQKDAEMKKMANQLIEYFLAKDSSKISLMFNDKDDLFDKEDEIMTDCDKFIQITDRHGIPSEDSMKFVKGENDENIVYVNLLTKPDSLLNLKTCKLIVFFLPDYFFKPGMGKVNFLNYVILPTKLIEAEKKIIKAPISVHLSK